MCVIDTWNENQNKEEEKSKAAGLFMTFRHLSIPRGIIDHFIITSRQCLLSVAE